MNFFIVATLWLSPLSQSYAGEKKEFIAENLNLPLTIQHGVYQDQVTSIQVQVKENNVPGITFIRFGPPFYYGFWLNTWTLDAYKDQFPSMEVVDLSKGTPSLINREDANLYKKEINQIDSEQFELIYESGSKNGYYYKKFVLVLDISTGQIKQLSYDKSYAAKHFSWWPSINNIVLFKLRLHTGPFFRSLECKSCQNLQLTTQCTQLLSK